MENQIPPQEIPQQSLPPAVEPNRNFWKYIGIGMSIVFFCLAIGIIGYAYVLNKNQTTIPVAVSQISTPTPTPDETASWQTYTNPQHGYSLKYPPSYKLINKDIDFISLESNMEISNGGAMDGGNGLIKGFSISINFSKQLDMSEIALKEYYGSDVLVGKFYLDNMEGTRVILPGINPIAHQSFYFKKGDGVLSIQPLSGDKTTQEENLIYDSELYQILSTFKFTN